MWVDGHRDVQVSVPEIPCTGTEDGFLGEEGAECESARVEAYVRQDAVTIAVPIEGTLTVAE